VSNQNKKHKYELLIPTEIRCAPGKLRDRMRRVNAELARSDTGEVIEHWRVEDRADKADGDLWL